MAALALFAALVLSACGSSADGGDGVSEGEASIAASGSRAQKVAQKHWIEGFEREEPGVKVAYAADGSGSGRHRFIAGYVAYAASDTPLEGVELQQAVERCKPGQLVEVPAYLSKVFVAVHVGDVAFVTLTPRTLARIFEGEITSWSDPEIRSANAPIAKRLSGPITVVFPADGTGTTENFTAYLAEAAPGAWRHRPSEAWPVADVGTRVDGDATMLKKVNAQEGAIAFIDASRSGRLKPVLIQRGAAASEVAVPDHGSSIAVLESSPEAEALKKSPYMMPFDLDRTHAGKSTYPIVFTSYLIACTSYDSAAEAAAVRGLLEYAVGNRGQEVAATEAGSDPLTGELQKRAEAAVQAIE